MGLGTEQMARRSCDGRNKRGKCNSISASNAVVACAARTVTANSNSLCQQQKPIFYVNVRSSPGSAGGGVTGLFLSPIWSIKRALTLGVRAWLLFRMRDALWFDCRDSQRADIQRTVSGTSSLLRALCAAQMLKRRLPADAAVGVTSSLDAALQRGVPRRNFLCLQPHLMSLAAGEFEQGEAASQRQVRACAYLWLVSVGVML
jgi:hypothetical protein